MEKAYKRLDAVLDLKEEESNILQQLTAIEKKIFELAKPYLLVKFCHIWPRWGTGSVPNNHFSELKKGIKEWFFLAASKKIAEKEYYERVQEIPIQNCQVPTIAIHP